jgi:hypothetical protein
MIYAFGVTYERDLGRLLSFIKKAQEGIFVFPEKFLNSQKTDAVKSLTELTKNERSTIITGVKNDSNFNAYVFAYGELMPVIDKENWYRLPDGDNKVFTTVRVGQDIWEPYHYQKFDLLANPSLISLDKLITAKTYGRNTYKNLNSMLGLGNKVVATATHMACHPSVFDRQGNRAEETKKIDRGYNWPIEIVAYEMGKKDQ